MDNTGKKVLIIDDDTTVHTVLTVIFRKAGYQVFTALDALQGTSKAAQVKPDLIVLDVLMPAGGGAAVLERLRKMSFTSHTPCLVYSSLSRADILKEIQEGPLVAVLCKGEAKSEDILQAAARIITG